MSQNAICFRPVTFGDRAAIDMHNEQLPPYADWTFGTLLAWWDYYDDLAFAFHRDNLLIRSSYLSLGHKQMITLVGRKDIATTVGEIFQFQRENAESQLIAASPAYILDGIRSKEDYVVDEDLDNAEYVISVEGHAKLDGPEYSRIRSVVKRFEHRYPSAAIRPCSLENIHDQEQILAAIDSFVRMRNNDVGGEERTVIARTVPIWREIDLRCACIYIEDEVRAVAFYKQIDAETINLGHVKVDQSLDNLFRYTIHRLAGFLHPQGIRFINIEQDLGIYGLRECKRRLRPVHMLRKVSLRPIGVDLSTGTSPVGLPRSSWG